MVIDAQWIEKESRRGGRPVLQKIVKPSTTCSHQDTCPKVRGANGRLEIARCPLLQGLLQVE